MPNTLNPACPFCGLRFENKPILDLHMREDHRQRASRERNSDGDPSMTRSPATGADIPAGAPEPAPEPAPGPAAPPSRTSAKAAAGPAGRRGPARRAKAALRRLLRGREEEQAQEPLRHETLSSGS